jgi:hypothetical protein
MIERHFTFIYIVVYHHPGKPPQAEFVTRSNIFPEEDGLKAKPIFFTPKNP